MSNHTNHRRGESHRTEHGPSWENPDPGAGCNSTHVARARKGWKRLANRSERRTGTTASGVAFRLKRRTRPEIIEP
jgi:hypothetical protein